MEEKKNKKEKLKKKLKNKQGITLIALVVTIVVLLILAGVSIAMLTGNNGILTQAQRAKEETKEAQLDEKNTLTSYEQIINTNAGVNLGTITGNETNNTVTQDSLGNRVVVPAGFKVVNPEDNVEDGIIIEDKDENQFVWIPAKSGLGTTINLNEGGTTTIKYERTDFGIQDGLYSDYSETMPVDEETSVNEFGGYYIGRYEAGDKESTESKTMRTVGASQTNTITIKKGQVPYNNITLDNIKKLSENMATKQGYKTAKTKLISSYAWDTAINFIQIQNIDYGINSQEGNYKDISFNYIDLKMEEQIKNNGQDARVPTGQTIAVSNIYDMGGNLYEYTTESYVLTTLQRVVRGGGHSNTHMGTPAGKRVYLPDTAAEINDNTTFRVALFLF